MTRSSAALRALGLVASLLVFDCSKPTSSDPSASGSALAVPATAAASAPPAPAPSAPSEAPSVDPGPSLVLTPEDAEGAAEHRISEQNLESELDRLEREIQAE